MTYYAEVIHDIQLHFYNPIRGMSQYGIQSQMGAPLPTYPGTETWDLSAQITATDEFYSEMKSYPLPNGKTWGDYAPSGLPSTNWEAWAEATEKFFDSPNDMTSFQEVPEPDGPMWERAISAETQERATSDLYIWALKLNLCGFYNQELQVLRNISHNRSIAEKHIDMPTWEGMEHEEIVDTMKHMHDEHLRARRAGFSTHHKPGEAT